MFGKGTKIPVRDLTPMFHQHNTDQHNHRSRKREKPSFSANFTNERTKSLERNQRVNEKNKELRQWINIKDNQIHELIAKVTKLLEENEKLKNDKAVLIDNYNSLLDKGEGTMNDDSQLDGLRKENENMKNDVSMLKILVFRLNKHIEYYQGILNEQKISFNPPTRYSNEHESSTSWTVNSHLLAPLINSYEERIREKNDIIKCYEQELNQYTVKLKNILEENEKAHEMFDSLRRNSDTWLTEKQRLVSQCDILRNKASIHAKRADLAKEKLVEVLKAYEQRIQSQSLDIERLQEAYSRSKGEITTLKSLQKNPEAVTESVRECQKLLEDLRVQFEVEKGQLIDDKNNLEIQLNQFREKVSELETLLEKQKLCNEALNEKNKMLKKSLHQEQRYRENFEKDANQYREYGNQSFQNISDLYNLVQEKEIIIQNLKFTHQKEMEEIRGKLQQRDQTLKKVLESKVSGSTKI